MANQEVPEEIQDYYQTERRERAGVAWLLAFGTLVVTILLAGLIFFGGRAAYRRFAGNDEPERADVAQNEDQKQEGSTESANEKKDQPQENRPESNSGSQGQGNAVQGNNEQNNTTPPPSSNQNQNQTPPSPSPPTPTTGDSGDLPNTGPTSTVAIFFAVSILGYAIHRLYLRSN